MTSPAVETSCMSCVDLRGSLARLDREFARVVRERDQYEEIARTRAARCTELLEEARALRAELAHLRHRDDHLTFGGGTINAAPQVYPQTVTAVFPPEEPR